MLDVSLTLWIELASNSKFLSQMSSQAGGYHSFLRAEKQDLLGERIVGELCQNIQRPDGGVVGFDMYRSTNFNETNTRQIQ